MPTTTKRDELVQGCCGLYEPGMDEADAEILAERFKALADPTRVRILNLLAHNDELCVCDIEANFDLSQPTISHHLSLLKKACLVESSVRGRQGFYRVCPDALEELSEALR